MQPWRLAKLGMLDKLKLLMGLLSAIHAAVMTAEVYLKVRAQPAAATQSEVHSSWLTAGATKSVARATNLGCSRSPPDKLKLLVGLLNAVHAAVMAVGVCGHSQQQRRSQKRTETGCHHLHVHLLLRRAG